MFDVPSCEGAARGHRLSGPRGCCVVDAAARWRPALRCSRPLRSANSEDLPTSIAVSSNGSTHRISRGRSRESSLPSDARNWLDVGTERTLPTEWFDTAGQSISLGPGDLRRAFQGGPTSCASRPMRISRSISGATRGRQGRHQPVDDPVADGAGG